MRTDMDLPVDNLASDELDNRTHGSAPVHIVGRRPSQAIIADLAKVV